MNASMHTHTQMKEVPTVQTQTGSCTTSLTLLSLSNLGGPTPTFSGVVSGLALAAGIGLKAGMVLMLASFFWVEI